MSPNAKRWFFGVATVVTATAAWYAPAPESDGIALSPRQQQVKPHGRDGPTAGSAGSTAAEAPRTNVASEVTVLSIRPRQRNEFIDAQIFSVTQWTMPQQKVDVAAPTLAESAPILPQAPSLPFVVLGRYEESGQTAIFLQHNEHNLVVRVGDTIDGQYKVESLKGSTLNLLYLPLNQIQSLEVGGSQ